MIRFLLDPALHLFFSLPIRGRDTVYIDWTMQVLTVGTESIQTPLHFSIFVILQPFAKII